jgi:hypothetical protein
LIGEPTREDSAYNLLDADTERGTTMSTDVEVLSDAFTLIKSDVPWVQNNDEFCHLNEPITLYCALAIPAKLQGKPINEDSVVFQNVAKSILEIVDRDPDYSLNVTDTIQFLLEFNNHPKTDRRLLESVLEHSMRMASDNVE